MKPLPLRFTQATGSGPLAESGGRLVGWGLRETSGAAPAVFDVYDSSSSPQNLLVPFSLAASESTRDWFVPHSMPFEAGVYINIVSGTFTGVLWVTLNGPDEDYPIPVIILEGG